MLSHFSHVWLFATPWIYNPWNSPDQNIGVGSLSLLQGIIPTQGLNPGLLHCRRILKKKIKKELIGSYISIITLDVNGLNAIKRHRLAGWMKSRACRYFHSPHHSAWPPFQLCYIVRLIIFPLWLAILIIFYFLSGYWFCKLLNIFYYCDYVTITHLIPLYHDWSTEK